MIEEKKKKKKKKGAPQTSKQNSVRGFPGHPPCYFAWGRWRSWGSIPGRPDRQLTALLAVKIGIGPDFASLAFASTLGVGVLFSSLMILVYTGGISLLAAQLTLNR